MKQFFFLGSSKEVLSSFFHCSDEELSVLLDTTEAEEDALALGVCMTQSRVGVLGGGMAGSEKTHVCFLLVVDLVRILPCLNPIHMI